MTSETRPLANDEEPRRANSAPGGSPEIHTRSPLRRIALAAGSLALLVALATDALSVAGRHVGLALVGTIEIFETAIVIAASSAIVIATLDHGHARVRMLLERMTPSMESAFERATDLVSALILVTLAAGSIWLLSDLWNGFEMTEVLGIPLRWFRIFWIVSCLVTAGIFTARALGRRP